MELVVSHRQSKFIAIDEQPNNNIVQLDAFRKANGLAHETFEACAKGQMLPLDLLGVVLAWVMLFGTELTRVRAPMIGVITGDSKGLLQLHKHLILASAKHVRQHCACAMIDGVPQPPLLLLLPHKAPHFIDFGVLYATDHDFDS